MPGLGIGWSEKLVCLPSWWFTRIDGRRGCDGVVGLGGDTSHRSSRGSSCPGHHPARGVWLSWAASSEAACTTKPLAHED